MATRFNTQVGNGEYRLQFETDNKEHYLFMQKMARRCVDAKPVVHGEWIEGEIERDPEIKFGRVYRRSTPTFQCSLCKETFAGSNYGFNYCPNCGAKMKGEET